MTSNTPHKVSWRKYIDKTSKNEARPLLVEALAFVANKDSALDIGAGALNDSKHLLSIGFNHVTAVDADEAAEERSRTVDDARFSFAKSAYADFDFKKESYDLINAQYSLPFNPPETFDEFMSGIISSLRPGGVFTGNFFGNRDGWNVESSGKTFHTEESARKTLSGLELIKFQEEESDKGTALGKPKHWHTFNFIAKKK
jgi:tellurite methyltransferase